MDAIAARQESATRRPLLFLGIALGACAGYYLGSVLGLLLRIPPATPSVIWPPNALVTATLLLVPPRRWWLVLLPVLPVHVFVQLPTGWPPALVLCLYFTNCLEAVLSAGTIWLLSDAPPHFDTPRRLSTFFVALTMASVISGFLDAAAVTWFLGEPYWTVWNQRFLSNVLAQLTIVPAVVGVAMGLPRWVRSVAWTRVAEAMAVGVGLIVMGSSNFGGALIALPPLRAVSTQAPLALQLPFLLWAAVRFGTAGAGVTLFAASILAVWSAVHGQGPFASMSPTTTVPALTLSLILVAATVLWLAALVQERRQTQSALAERLGFEELLARLSGAFVEVPSDRMDAGFAEWLGRLAMSLNVECVCLYTLSGRDGSFTSGYHWTAPGASGPQAVDLRREFPWTFGRLQQGRSVAIPAVRGLPAQAAEDGTSMRRHGYEAMLVLPLASSRGALGALAFGSVTERSWSDELVMRLRVVAEVFANALARKQTEDALRASETMKSSILQSLRSGVAVVDREGRVLALNANWTRLAEESGAPVVTVGDALLDGGVARPSEASAAELAAGVRSVLEGVRDSFGYEYTTQTAAGPRWWSVVVDPLDRPDGGAVVTRADVTDLRTAEFDVQRTRQELAHVGRVSTVGELTASLAHELYQPLTAIMTNAQAARRMLAAAQPDVAQIHLILSDIVNDDRRASDVIERLRDLLRKGELEMVPVDLASTIRDVADLLRGDAIVKQVQVTLDLDGYPVVVFGDRVQLQQVMLNLLHNAMEAMADGRSRAATTVSVRCRRVESAPARSASSGQTPSTGSGLAQVTVRDTGPGLLAGAEDTVFDPFYTTKKDGMGMGLSIVRTIIESHGGSITAANHELGGAVFEFTLPLAGVD